MSILNCSKILVPEHIKNQFLAPVVGQSWSIRVSSALCNYSGTESLSGPYESFDEVQGCKRTLLAQERALGAKLEVAYCIISTLHISWNNSPGNVAQLFSQEKKENI